ALVVGLYLAYGAAVTSLGLALATWLRRLDYAVAINVAVLGGVTVGWMVGVLMIMPGQQAPAIAAGSPIIGIAFPTATVQSLSSLDWENIVYGWSAWIAIYNFIAAMLGLATLATFDRCLGRITDTAPRFPERSSHKLKLEEAEGIGARGAPAIE